MVTDVTLNSKTTVEVKLIFSNTASITNSTVFEFTPNAFDAKSSGSNSDNISMLKKLHQAQIQQSKFQFIAKVVNFVTSIKGTSKSTQIIEAVVPLSKLKQPSKIILISDFIQESKLRNFTKIRVRSEEQIVAIALKDVVSIKKKYIIPKVLQKMNITCLLPVVQDADNPLYQFIPSYYKTFFEAFGYNLKFERL